MASNDMPSDWDEQITASETSLANIEVTLGRTALLTAQNARTASNHDRVVGTCWSIHGSLALNDSDKVQTALEKAATVIQEQSE